MPDGSLTLREILSQGLGESQIIYLMSSVLRGMAFLWYRHGWYHSHCELGLDQIVVLTNGRVVLLVGNVSETRQGKAHNSLVGTVDEFLSEVLAASPADSSFLRSFGERLTLTDESYDALAAMRHLDSWPNFRDERRSLAKLVASGGDNLLSRPNATDNLTDRSRATGTATATATATKGASLLADAVEEYMGEDPPRRGSERESRGGVGEPEASGVSDGSVAKSKKMGQIALAILIVALLSSVSMVLVGGSAAWVGGVSLLGNLALLFTSRRYP